VSCFEKGHHYKQSKRACGVSLEKEIFILAKKHTRDSNLQLLEQDFCVYFLKCLQLVKTIPGVEMIKKCTIPMDAFICFFSKKKIESKNFVLPNRVQIELLKPKKILLIIFYPLFNLDSTFFCIAF
jgi:hypothetical protein